MRLRIELKEGDIVGGCIYLKELPTKVIGKNSIKRYATFKCRCGNEFDAQLLDVKRKEQATCGCATKAAAKRMGLANKDHGYRQHPLYKMWQGMIRRCSNPKDFAYYNYGARGITVCESWFSIEKFIEDVYEFYLPGLELDRIDNNQGYSKSNCRWVTRKQNMNNMRRNRLIEYKGETKTVSEWSDYLTIPYKTLLARLNNWTVEKAFNYGKEETN